jgi:hypothetical protein
MTSSGAWLLRVVGLSAAVGLGLVAAGIGAALRAGTWLAVPDLAALELTVVAALGLTTTSLLAAGRRALQLDRWAGAPGWRGRLQRPVLLWCASLAAVLGALPALALELGPPAIWPLGLIALATIAARAIAGAPPSRVAWVLCCSYGLAATASLVIVRHVL